jgi:hypothetical protein
MKNISDKSSRETQNTHFMFNNNPPPQNHAVYETVWKNVVQQGHATGDSMAHVQCMLDT